jgi:hypothetical protein
MFPDNGNCVYCVFRSIVDCARSYFKSSKGGRFARIIVPLGVKNNWWNAWQGSTIHHQPGTFCTYDCPSPEFWVDV